MARVYTSKAYKPEFKTIIIRILAWLEKSKEGTGGSLTEGIKE